MDSADNTNTVQRLGGWKRLSSELRGHTLGHWLSGMASLYEAMGGTVQRGAHGVSGLPSPGDFRPGRACHSVTAATESVVYVNQWIPAEFDNGTLKLRLETDFPRTEKATLRVLAGSGKVAIRHPYWGGGALDPATAADHDKTRRSTYTYHTVAAGDVLPIDLTCAFHTEAPRLAHVALEPPETWTRLTQPPPHVRVWDDASYDAEPYWGEPTFRTPAGLIVSTLWSVHNERYVVYWN